MEVDFMDIVIIIKIPIENLSKENNKGIWIEELCFNYSPTYDEMINFCELMYKKDIDFFTNELKLSYYNSLWEQLIDTLRQVSESRWVILGDGTYAFREFNHNKFGNVNIIWKKIIVNHRI
jgi:hypothetical protein